MTEASASSSGAVNRPRLAVSMARRRQNILDAAIELFQKQGYLGTTVDDIAALAGVTKRTLYHHMGNKENILAEIHTGFIEAGLRRWEAVLDEGGTPTVVLRRLIEEHVRIVALHRKAIAVFFEEAKHLDVGSRRRIAVQRDRYESILRATIRDGVDAGEFRSDLDVKVLSLLILGGLTEMYRWFRPKSKAAEEALTARCGDLALDGVGRGSHAA